MASRGEKRQRSATDDFTTREAINSEVGANKGEGRVPGGSSCLPSRSEKQGLGVDGAVGKKPGRRLPLPRRLRGTAGLSFYPTNEEKQIGKDVAESSRANSDAHGNAETVQPQTKIGERTNGMPKVHQDCQQSSVVADADLLKNDVSRFSQARIRGTVGLSTSARNDKQGTVDAQSQGSTKLCSSRIEASLRAREQCVSADIEKSQVGKVKIDEQSKATMRHYTGSVKHSAISVDVFPIQVTLKSDCQGEWTALESTEQIKVVREGRFVRMMDTTTELNGEESSSGMIRGIVIHEGNQDGEFELTPEAHAVKPRSGGTAKILGLTSAVGIGLNGKYCKILGQNLATKRWEVELTDSNETKSLKEENLECVQVMVRGVDEEIEASKTMGSRSKVVDEVLEEDSACGVLPREEVSASEKERCSHVAQLLSLSNRPASIAPRKDLDRFAWVYSQSSASLEFWLRCEDPETASLLEQSSKKAMDCLRCSSVGDIRTEDFVKLETFLSQSVPWSLTPLGMRASIVEGALAGLSAVGTGKNIKMRHRGAIVALAVSVAVHKPELAHAWCEPLKALAALALQAKEANDEDFVPAVETTPCGKHKSISPHAEIEHSALADATVATSDHARAAEGISLKDCAAAIEKLSTKQRICKDQSEHELTPESASCDHNNDQLELAATRTVTIRDSIVVEYEEVEVDELSDRCVPGARRIDHTDHELHSAFVQSCTSPLEELQTIARSVDAKAGEAMEDSLRPERNLPNAPAAPLPSQFERVTELNASAKTEPLSPKRPSLSQPLLLKEAASQMRPHELLPQSEQQSHWIAETPPIVPRRSSRVTPEVPSPVKVGAKGEFVITAELAAPLQDPQPQTIPLPTETLQKEPFASTGTQGVKLSSLKVSTESSSPHGLMISRPKTMPRAPVSRTESSPAATTLPIGMSPASPEGAALAKLNEKGSRGKCDWKGKGKGAPFASSGSCQDIDKQNGSSADVGARLVASASPDTDNEGLLSANYDPLTREDMDGHKLRAASAESCSVGDEPSLAMGSQGEKAANAKSSSDVSGLKGRTISLPKTTLRIPSVPIGMSPASPLGAALAKLNGKGRGKYDWKGSGKGASLTGSHSCEEIDKQNGVSADVGARQVASASPHAETEHSARADPIVAGSERADGVEGNSLKDCAAEIEKLSTKQRSFPRCASYCCDWLLKGRCWHANCVYLHKFGDVATTSKSVIGTSFNKEDAFKQICNRVLRELSEPLADRRCFVLDGKKGATVAALGRLPDEVMSPNIDMEVVCALQDQCVAVSCSSSIALMTAMNCQIQFGCIYLDYMWPLDYFEKLASTLTSSLEKNPNATCGNAKTGRAAAIYELLSSKIVDSDGFRDVERLLEPGSQLLSSEGSVLAVTIVFNRQSPLAAQRTQLESILCKGGEKCQRRIQRLGKCEAKGRPVAALFYGIDFPPAHICLTAKTLKGFTREVVALYPKQGSRLIKPKTPEKPKAKRAPRKNLNAPENPLPKKRPRNNMPAQGAGSWVFVPGPGFVPWSGATKRSKKQASTPQKKAKW